MTGTVSHPISEESLRRRARVLAEWVGRHVAEPTGRWSAAGSLAAGTRRRGSGLGPQLLAA